MMPNTIENGESGSSVRAKINAAMNRVSLTKFGVQMNTVSDQSAAVQAAFDDGSPLWFPPGTIYLNNTIDIPTSLNLQGAGPANSLFRAMVGMTADLMHIKSGQVRYVTMRDFGLQGVPANTGQNAIVIIGNVGSGTNGGLWDSLFENIKCRGFDGVQLGLLGAPLLDNTTPVQFVKFSRLDFERPDTNSGPVLYAHGQVEHITFDHCRLHGNASGTVTIGGTNVYLGRPFGASGVVIGPLGTGTPFSAIAPKSITFIECSNENADKGYIFDSAENVQLLGGWFEQIDTNSILAQSTSLGILSANQRFANAALGASGKAIRANSLAQVVCLNPRWAGTNTTTLSTDGSGSILPIGGSGGTSVENVYHDRSIASGVTQVDFGNNPGAYVGFTSAGITLNQLSSSLGPGEFFTLKVKPTGNPGALSNSGNNVTGFNLGVGVTSLTLELGCTVLLRRSQVGKGWDFVSKV